ncbi:TetR/AcrR family transcriptional regulator [Rhodococcus sp. WS4]|nr:TetR/AcrR family transcriptional regulator [Rhodococcus sp. WS4]
MVAVLDKRTRDDPRRRATELAFLNATEGLLNEGASYTDLNVSRIAERADRTRTAFYAHFEDRRELLLALIAESSGEALTALQLLFGSDGELSQDEIRKSVRSLLATFREHATVIRAVIEAAGYDEGIAEYWDNIVGRVVDAARGRLRVKGFGDSEAAATATSLVWMTERMCYQQAVRGCLGLDDEAVIAGISSLWLTVLCTGKAGG